MEYEKYLLDNGTELYVVQSSLWKTTNVTMGFYSQKDGTEGLKGLVPTILTEGSANYPTRQEISMAVEKEFATSLYTSRGSSGDLHAVKFGLNVLTEEKLLQGQKTLENSLGLLKEIITDPLIEKGKFKESYYKRQKEELIDEIKQREMDARSFAIKKFYELALGNSRFNYPSIGTEKQAEMLVNPNSAFTTYEKMLATFPRKVFVATNLEANCIVDTVRKAFSELPKVDSGIEISDPPIKICRELSEGSRFKQSIVHVGFPVKVTKNKKKKEALYLLNYYLGGYANGKIFKEVRTERQLAYYAFSSLDLDSCLIYGYGGVDRKKIEETIEVISEEIKKAAKGEIEKKELSEAQYSLLNALAMVKHKKSTKMSVVENAVLHGKLEDVREWENKFKEISYEDVESAASLIDTSSPIVHCLRQEEEE
ncbi:MAG: insulinase family protein [Candidatus Woesearchaeota archaeon]